MQENSAVSLSHMRNYVHTGRVYVRVLTTISLMLIGLQNAAGNNWQQAPPMNTGRSEIHATLLDNNIYIVGGIGNFRTLKSCERFDVNVGRWYACPALDRKRHHVALATDGPSGICLGVTFV